MLMEFFTEASCFKELDIKQNDLYKVVQKMEYKRLEQNKFIFHIGDVGDYFYILIHGKVQLLLPNPQIPQIQRNINFYKNRISVERRSEELFEDNEKTIANMKKIIQELEEQLEKMPALTPTGVIDPVKAFGERSLLKDLPRAGSTKCLTECYFAIVSKDSYIKLLRKVENENGAQMTRFLKQIPYIRSWINREVAQLKYLMKVEKFEKRGFIVAKEGTKCDKIYIIKDGEFEIVKTDLSNLFYNSVAGTVALCESDKRTMIKSEF